MKAVALIVALALTAGAVVFHPQATAVHAASRGGDTVVMA